jgi:uncharacterized caspase-like protein
MSERRIALVIGNSAYQKSPPLKNPVNDAALVTRALLRRGFEVVGGASTEAYPTGMTAGKDLNSLALSMTFAQFKAQVQQVRELDPDARPIVVIYFAGHGVQVGDKNYLVPVDDTLDANLNNLGLLDIKAEMATLVSLVGEEGSVVLFLDACRNGPLSAEQKLNLMNLLERTEPEEADRPSGYGDRTIDGANTSIAATRGRLATFKMTHEDGCGRTFIGFATAPGDLAQDGLDGNSAFALALARHLEVRGLNIEDLFDRVARDVIAVVKRDYDGTIQDPWSETNLNQPLFLHARDPRPVWMLGLGGLVAGLFICLAVFKEGKLIGTVPVTVWFLGLAFGLVVALGSLHWGSGRKPRDLFLALAGPAIGFALALAILKVLPAFPINFARIEEPTGDAPIASLVYKTVVLIGGALYLIGTWLVRREKDEPPPRTWLGRLNRILTWGLPFVIVAVLWRLEAYLTGATPEQTAFAMFAVLGGVIYAGSIPLALRAQGGLFSQFGPFTGAMTIGLLMAAFFGFYEMGRWTLGIADETPAAQALLVGLGMLWHGLLGAQVGYCFAYYVPDHRVPR